MALISCPDCGNPVSDDADECKLCGLHVKAYLQRMREEEEARRLEAEAEAERQRRERERERGYTVLTIIGVLLFILVGSCISQNQGQPSAGKDLYEMDGQSQSITPGVNTFSASGKLKLDYSCALNAQSAAAVQLVLVNTDSSATVWKKAVKCPASGSETIQVKLGEYDVGASVNGDAAWTLKVTQM
jgi:hypothetical protein